MNGGGCVPVKLQKQVAGGIWPMDHGLMTPDPDCQVIEKQSNILFESLHFEVSLFQ